MKAKLSIESVSPQAETQPSIIFLCSSLTDQSLFIFAHK
jgi:hypothetical protein